MSDKHSLNIKEIVINPLLQKLRENPIAKESENSFFESFDRTKIFYRLWQPETIKKILIINHGMGGHGEYFVLLADRLIENEIMVIVPDYRNHGFSEGKKGDLKKFRYLLKDLHCFINFISNRYKNIPIYLCGDSMGGTVCINFAKEFPETFLSLSGLVLFSPGIKIKLSKKFLLGLIFLAFPLFLIRICFPSIPIISVKGREELGIKNRIHQQYDREDPIHLKKISTRYLFQLFKYMRKTRKIAPYIPIPTVIFQGTEDKGISMKYVQIFFENISFKDKKLELIEGGYHALLTDPDFQNKWSVMINWFKQH
ncbi:MAG: alpha/beta fold hydrolase [Candidatus Hodarchaeota archaeon]